MRIRDPELLRQLHFEWEECALCGRTKATFQLSLHHIFERHDLRGNLVMLCGSGTTGCHGQITVNDPVKLAELGLHIVKERPDVLEYLVERMGETPAEDWCRRRLSIICEA